MTLLNENREYLCDHHGNKIITDNGVVCFRCKVIMPNDFRKYHSVTFHMRPTVADPEHMILFHVKGVGFSGTRFQRWLVKIMECSITRTMRKSGANV